MALLGRAVLGGLAGGLMTGSWGGVAGGAAMGTLGWGGLNRLGGGLNVAGGMRTGLGWGMRGLRAGRMGLQRQALGSAMRGRFGGATAAGYGADLLRMGSTGLASARSFIGRKALMTNRVAGYTAGAMGIGAGAYIGNTVISSNRY